MCEREPCKSLPTCATRGFKQHTHQPHHNGLTVTNIRVALTLRLIICHRRGGCCICWPRLGFPCPAIPVSTDSTTGTLGATAPGGNCYVHMEQAYIYTNMMRPLGSKKKVDKEVALPWPLASSTQCTQITQSSTPHLRAFVFIHPGLYIRVHLRTLTADIQHQILLHIYLPTVVIMFFSIMVLPHLPEVCSLQATLLLWAFFCNGWLYKLL